MTSEIECLWGLQPYRSENVYQYDTEEEALRQYEFAWMDIPVYLVKREVLADGTFSKWEIVK